jgi:RNA polymerase sigma factor (sigma-70 family)
MSTFAVGGDNSLDAGRSRHGFGAGICPPQFQAAFTELVQRHIALVYSVARRCTGNDGDAQDVTQAVFILLARRAAGLRERTLLPGWLYETTRFTAARLLRTNVRRQKREQEAYMQSTLNEADAANVWEKLSPHLEAAMSKLAERDRALLVLRFYQNRSGPEAAALMGIREDAAHKRVHRALEKLRKFFMKRGVDSTATTIAETISVNSVQAAPVALAKAVTAVAVAKSATASTSTLTLVKGALKVMAWSKAQTAIVVGVGVLLAAGAGTMLVERAARQPDIQGAWEGTLEYGPQKERIVIKVVKDNGSYRATGDAINLGVKDFPFNEFVYDHPSVHFERDYFKGDSNNFIYDATLNSDMSEMSGTWKQNGVSSPLILKRTTQPDSVPEKLKGSDYAPRTGSDLQSFWAGMVKIGTNSWLLYFKIAEQPDGTFRAESDGVNTNVLKVEFLAQGWENVPATLIAYQQPSVDLEFSAIGHVFRGEINSDHSEMIGMLTVGNTTVPLTMKRADPNSEDSRLMPVAGIGVALNMDKQTSALRITQVVPNLPAAQAGLTAGIIIQKVDGVPIGGKSLQECVDLIHGAAGTKVRLELVDPSKNETNTVELTRQIIQP